MQRCLLDRQNQGTHELTETVVASTSSVQDQTSQYYKMEEEGITSPYPS